MINVISTLEGNLIKSVKVPETMQLSKSVAVIKCFSPQFLIFVSSNPEETYFHLTRLNLETNVFDNLFVPYKIYNF